MSYYSSDVAAIVQEHGFVKASQILRERAALAALEAQKPEPTMGDAFEGTQEEWDRWLLEWKKKNRPTPATRSR